MANKLNFFSLLLLALLTISHASVNKSYDACSNCLNELTDEEYFNCVERYCKSQSAGLSAHASVSDLSQALIQKSAESPNSLMQFLLVEEKSCRECAGLLQGSDYFLSCYKENCKTEAQSLVESAGKSSRCAECGKFTSFASQAESCAVFNCRQEIYTQMTQLHPEVPAMSLSACTDKCYEMYLESGLDYSECVKRYCKKRSLEVINTESKDTVKCEACWDITDHDYLSYCLRTYCSSTFISSFRKIEPSELNLGCVDCSDYYEAGLYDEYENCIQRWCKDDLATASHEYFAKTGLTLGRKLNQCHSCQGFKQDQSKFSTCIMTRCEKDVLDQGIYLGKDRNGGSLNSVKMCVGEEGKGNENCYQGKFYEEFVALFEVYMERSAQDESKFCNQCLVGGFEAGCLVKNCQKQVSGKTVLFGQGNVESLGKKCKVCMDFDGVSYLSCIKYNCAGEMQDRALDLAAGFDVKGFAGNAVKVNSCVDCLKSQEESEFQYLCYDKNCKSAAFSKDLLLTSSSSKGCQKCGKYSDEKFSNCAYFACRSEMKNLISIDHSLSLKSLSSINLNECTDSCYYDWYYYGYDYKVCVYEYCNSREPMTRPINFKSIEHKNTCKNSCSSLSSVSCLAAFCEQSTLQSISRNSLEAQCRTCSQDLDKEVLTAYGFRACAAAYCRKEIEKESLVEDNKVGLLDVKEKEEGRPVLALSFGFVGVLTTVVVIGAKLRRRFNSREEGEVDYRLI